MTTRQQPPPLCRISRHPLLSRLVAATIRLKVVSPLPPREMLLFRISPCTLFPEVNIVVPLMNKLIVPILVVSVLWDTLNRGIFLNIVSSALLLNPPSVLEAVPLNKTPDVLIVVPQLLLERITTAILPVRYPRRMCKRGVVLRLVARVLTLLPDSVANTPTQCPVLLLSMPS